MSFDEIMKKVEEHENELKANAREYYEQNKGKQSCDTCTCSYESCTCKTVGGLCAYQ